MAERFYIVSIKPVGLRVPLIWRIPALGRMIQPVAEAVFVFMPGLYHEKVYLLKKKAA
jgi:hypothetical protein